MIPSPEKVDQKDWDMNPQEISINSVSSVLGKWDMVVYLRSGYRQKYIPEYYEYSIVSPEKIQQELAKSQVEPRMFFGARDAANFISNNSFFATDTYVINPPGTQVFFVYQLWNIRNFEIIIKQLWKWVDVESILKEKPRSPYDDLWLRRPEREWLDDIGRPLKILNMTDLSTPSGRDDRYIDMSLLSTNEIDRIGTLRRWWDYNSLIQDKLIKHIKI